MASCKCVVAERDLFRYTIAAAAAAVATSRFSDYYQYFTRRGEGIISTAGLGHKSLVASDPCVRCIRHSAIAVKSAVRALWSSNRTEVETHADLIRTELLKIRLKFALES